MSFGGYVKESPELRPALNVGCLMGIPTGRYLKGKRGEMILDGGLQLVTGVGGRGNTFKSTLAHFFTLITLDRYAPAVAGIYDTEPPSVSRMRISRLHSWMPHIGGADLFDNGRLVLSDSTVMLGDEWFDGVKQAGENKIAKENIKSNTGTTPFIDRHGQPIKMLYPWLAENDSLSMMTTASVDAIYDKNMIGASGMNVEALRGSGAKSQMLMQMSTIPGMYGIYFIFTAHVGDDLALDPYAPPQKKLQFLKNKIKFKQVPEKFTFVTNNLYYCLSASVLQNDTTKGPQYPRNSDDNMKGDTDLQVIEVQNLRSKAGPSGMPFELVVSQSEGILPSLSEFHYLKKYGGYGLGGNDRTYFLELVPDVSMQRTTVRSKINESAKIRRALEITSEMCQMELMWHDLDPELRCSPAELYKSLTEKGYEWDTLLNTRGYWVFEESEKDELPFLSTMDLLRMRVGLYHPFWLEDDNKTIKKEFRREQDLPDNVVPITKAKDKVAA